MAGVAGFVWWEESSPTGCGEVPAAISLTETSSWSIASNHTLTNITMTASCSAKPADLADVGLKLVQSGGALLRSGNGSACPGGSDPSACRPPSGGNLWYASALGSDGKVVSSFPATSGGQTWTDGTVQVPSATSLMLVGSVKLAGSSDSFQVYGLNAWAITGSCTL